MMKELITYGIGPDKGNFLAYCLMAQGKKIITIVSYNCITIVP